MWSGSQVCRLQGQQWGAVSEGKLNHQGLLYHHLLSLYHFQGHEGAWRMQGLPESTLKKQKSENPDRKVNGYMKGIHKY